MKNIKKILIKIVILFLPLLFFSCSSDITLELQEDGKIKITYSGNFASDFTKNLLLQNNFEQEDFQNEDVQLDEQSLKESLEKSGFSNIIFLSNNLEKLCIQMEDKNLQSSFFNTGLIEIDKNTIKTNFSSENLKIFYNLADEELQMNLDLLIAPVFNDEQMPVEEYIEMISTFYGEQIAEEIKNCKLQITTIDSKGKNVISLGIPELLCGMY